LGCYDSIYIAQAPLCKVMSGRDERHLKDDLEEAGYMVNVVLSTTAVPRAKAQTSSRAKR